MSAEFTIFTCNDMEEAWVAQLCADSDREQDEMERQEDLDNEELIAHDAVDQGEVESWPWYTDAPLEVEDPEVVEDADLLGFPAVDPDSEFDDELDVESMDADLEEDAW